MTDTSNIPLLRFLRPTVGEVLHHTLSTVVLSSIRANWQKVAVEEHRFLNYELHDAIYVHHVLALNIGPPITCEVKKNGRFQHIRRPTGTTLRCCRPNLVLRRTFRSLSRAARLAK